MNWLRRDADADRGSAPTLLLLGALLVPVALLLWFMNEAVTAQAAAARQSILEAYRGQLRLARARVDAHWRAQSAELRQGDNSPEQLFAHLVVEHQADAVALLDRDGRVTYPSCCGAAAAPVPAANEPSRMGPIEAALRLSSEVVAAGVPAPVTEGFTRARTGDLWALSSPDRRVVAFYRTGRIQLMMHDVLEAVNIDEVRFIALPPGSGNDEEAIAAGPMLPGWQLTFELTDPEAVGVAARQRVMPSVWIGFAGIVVIAAGGVVAGTAFRRHLRLARLKTDLVASVSHELRTPLASMRVLVDGLLADREIDPAKTREYLAMMAAENARLSRVIENFLTFSRLERRRHQFVFSPVAPRAVVEDAVAAVRDRVPPGCAIGVEIAPDLPAAIADPDALATALVNLLDNALKYTPADKRIVVSARLDGGDVVFAVEDNGIGIPAREQRRIFRRFYRVDQRLSSDTNGVGLGLSIVEFIARAHGGAVSVRSGDGRGSTFSLRVPCAPEGAAAEATA